MAVVGLHRRAVRAGHVRDPARPVPVPTGLPGGSRRRSARGPRAPSRPHRAVVPGGGRHRPPAAGQHRRRPSVAIQTRARSQTVRRRQPRAVAQPRADRGPMLAERLRTAEATRAPSRLRAGRPTPRASVRVDCARVGAELTHVSEARPAPAGPQRRLLERLHDRRSVSGGSARICPSGAGRAGACEQAPAPGPAPADHRRAIGLDASRRRLSRMGGAGRCQRPLRQAYAALSSRRHERRS